MNNFCGYRLFPASVFVLFRLQNSSREFARVFQEEIEFLLWTVSFLFCEHALWDALAAWREKEGELSTTSLEFEFHLQFLH